MNDIEAQLILVCKIPRTTAQIVEMLSDATEDPPSYNYVNYLLNGLVRFGMMGKSRGGRIAWYKSLDRAILAVVEYLNRKRDEAKKVKMESVMMMNDNNKRLTEYSPTG